LLLLANGILSFGVQYGVFSLSLVRRKRSTNFAAVKTHPNESEETADDEIAVITSFSNSADSNQSSAIHDIELGIVGTPNDGEQHVAARSTTSESELHGALTSSSTPTLQMSGSTTGCTGAAIVDRQMIGPSQMTSVPDKPAAAAVEVPDKAGVPDKPGTTDEASAQKNPATPHASGEKIECALCLNSKPEACFPKHYKTDPQMNVCDRQFENCPHLFCDQCLARYQRMRLGEIKKCNISTLRFKEIVLPTMYKGALKKRIQMRCPLCREMSLIPFIKVKDEEAFLERDEFAKLEDDGQTGECRIIASSTPAASSTNVVVPTEILNNPTLHGEQSEILNTNPTLHAEQYEDILGPPIFIDPDSLRATLLRYVEVNVGPVNVNNNRAEETIANRYARQLGTQLCALLCVIWVVVGFLAVLWVNDVPPSQ